MSVLVIARMPTDREMTAMKPHAKVAAGSAAGALAVLIVFVLGQAGVDVPPEVASALTVVLGSAAAYLKAA